MSKALLYIHGKGGSSKEAEQIKPLCDGYDVHGIDLAGFTPWGTEDDFVNTHGAKLTVMPKGEHSFHTPEQIAFLGKWLASVIPVSD